MFADSELLSGNVTSSEIVSGLDSTSAKAVVKNGEIVVYAVNKSPVSVPFNLGIDSTTYNGAYTHEALQFNDVNDFPSFNLGDSALSPITSTPGSITLPPLSISVLTIADPPESPVYGSLIAGWDTWDSGANPTASFTAPGIIGSAVTTSEGLDWHTNDGRGASADGDWGTFAGPPTASTEAGEDVLNENLELSNATTGGTITFTLTNNGTTDIELDGFHFDAYAFRPKAARTYELSVASGDITGGVIYSSPDDEITHVGGTWDNNAHDDIDHSLSRLADNILEAGGTVDFLLAFSGGAGDGSGGHDLWIDNIGVTGRAIGLPGDFNGDGIVDAGDYVVWRSNLGAAETGSTLNGNGTGGTVDEDDYDLWKLNFGNSSGDASLSSVAVPEPGAIVLIVCGLMLGLAQIRAIPR